MITNPRPETLNRNEDLFQWGHKQAAGGTLHVTCCGNKYGKTLRTKLLAMTAALEKTRTIHWKYFHERFGWDDRACRAIAEASGGHIISFDGGYVLNQRATDEEFAQANGRIRNQAEKMKHRAELEKEVREKLVGRA